MKRTYHPDLRATLHDYERQMSLSVVAGRVVRWRNRAKRFRQWPRLLRRLVGGRYTQLLLDLAAEVAEADYLEEVMVWENPLSGEM